MKQFENQLSQKFFERYGIVNAILPEVEVVPEVYYEESVPYMILFRYNLSKLSDAQKEQFGKALFAMTSRFVNDGFKEVDGVRLSPDEKYFINSAFDNEREHFNVLMQAKDDEEILIRHVLAVTDGYLGKIPEPKHQHVDMETTPEEAADFDDDYDDENQ